MRQHELVLQMHRNRMCCSIPIRLRCARGFRQRRTRAGDVAEKQLNTSTVQQRVLVQQAAQSSAAQRWRGKCRDKDFASAAPHAACSHV